MVDRLSKPDHRQTDDGVGSLVEQTLAALAFAGDLSMGQPPEHSPATTVLTANVAEIAGASPAVQALAAQLALLRWAGCSANAREFADLLGDDVRGRAELLAGRNPFVAADPPAGPIYDSYVPLVVAHCETAAIVAERLGLDARVRNAVADYFENWDGTGMPDGKRGAEIDPIAQYVALAGDIEVYTRHYGEAQAAVLIAQRAGKIYEAGLAATAISHAGEWANVLAGLDLHTEALRLAGLGDLPMTLDSCVLLLADFADLKRPERTGANRLAEDLARGMARLSGLPKQEQDRIGRATALADLGEIAVSNAAFASGWVDQETRRLSPHWTERILSRVGPLAEVARLAGLAHERLDGSGYNRGLRAAALGPDARIVQVARAATALRLDSGGTDWPVSRIREELGRDVRDGRLDGPVVRLALETMGARGLPPVEHELAAGLTPRERDVLSGLIRGRSNKQIARDLDLSPKTVGTHLENVYRKLNVSSRAAAAMKALEGGLFSRP